MNEMQQAFERWAKQEGYSIAKKNGTYRFDSTLHAWIGWRYAALWNECDEQVDKSVAIPERTYREYK